MIAPRAYAGAAGPVGTRAGDGQDGRTAPETVLIIDPDPDSRYMYAALLRHHGFRVVEASNGADGIMAACAVPPDLIITELLVPSGTGWKVPKLLKRDPRTAGIPILALTSRVVPGGRERALAAGCERYLAKPCEPSRLLGEVQELLAETGASEGPMGSDGMSIARDQG